MSSSRSGSNKPPKLSSRRSSIRNRTQEARLREFAAINRVRRGESKTLSHAVQLEGTTLKNVQRKLPSAIAQDRPGGPIRVKPSDRYSARVEIVTDVGPLVVTASGSRQRELAGQHRATVMRVLRGKEPASALEQFKDKKVGGHTLISDFDLLSALAQGGVLDQLDSLYVSPETRP